MHVRTLSPEELSYLFERSAQLEKRWNEAISNTDKLLVSIYEKTEQTDKLLKQLGKVGATLSSAVSLSSTPMSP